MYVNYFPIHTRIETEHTQANMVASSKPYCYKQQQNFTKLHKKNVKNCWKVNKNKNSWSRWKRDLHFKSPLMVKLPSPMKELKPHCDFPGGSKWVFSQQQQRLCLFKPSSKTSPQFANTQRVCVPQLTALWRERLCWETSSHKEAIPDCYSSAGTWTEKHSACRPNHTYYCACKFFCLQFS